ncbi:MAG: 16S rRNA (guanine(966)-N(2))-methyltransferase RsmD [Terracidiphilus sp.]
MRIIAGTYRSRRLEAPPGLRTRPTSDRLRETLFNVLAPRIAGAIFLDLYAGSGAVGLEALSRGAARVTFVERAPAALKVLRKNLEQLGITTGFEVRAESVAAFLRFAAKFSPKPERHEVPKPIPHEVPERYDVAFLDPPYDDLEEYAVTLGMLGRNPVFLAPEAVIVAEHRRKQKLEERYGCLRRTRLLEQGDAALSFYAAELTHQE